jgi:hypothetical protein
MQKRPSRAPPGRLRLLSSNAKIPSGAALTIARQEPGDRRTLGLRVEQSDQKFVAEKQQSTVFQIGDLQPVDAFRHTNRLIGGGGTGPRGVPRLTLPHPSPNRLRPTIGPRLPARAVFVWRPNSTLSHLFITIKIRLDFGARRPQA